MNKDDMIEMYDNINIPFGIRKENKKLLMGNNIMNFSVRNNALNNDNMYLITIANKQYELTSGLTQLLLRKKPDLTLITDKEKLMYKDMLYRTSAHKRNYNPLEQLKGDKSIKYRDIIKPLFLNIESDSEPKFGGNLLKLKRYKPNTDLVYWDDPNELIERLKLLIASRDAGNSNNDNEISYIIEELKEAEIIKE